MSKESAKKTKTASKTTEIKIESNELDPRIFEEPGMNGLFRALYERIVELKEKETENKNCETESLTD